MSGKVENNGLEVNVGLFGAWTNEVVIGKEVTYGGDVSHIDGAPFENEYEWGLCVYHYDGEFGHFPVIDDYVEQ